MYEKNFVLPLTNYNCNVILQDAEWKKTNENESFERTISIIIIIVIQHI